MQAKFESTQYSKLKFSEDQQANEDEGIIIPMKPNVPINPRHHNNFFQPQPHQIPPPFARTMPMYSVTNSPIAMMNYFNTQTNSHHLPSVEHEQHYHAPVQHTQHNMPQHIPIDLVSFQRNFHH